MTANAVITNQKGLYMIQKFLQMTAWPMTPPRPYSPFHILLSLAGIGFALCLSLFLARNPAPISKNQSRWGRKSQGPDSIPASDRREGRALRRLFFCGIFLAVSEVYKQLFLTLVVHPGVYDWWYFPFQLCSVPMYLCLLLPLLPERGRQITCTFLQDFSLLGGFLALAEPSGLMHPYITLTLHGFFWHFTLIFIGATCSLSGLSLRKPAGFLSSLPLFLGCCLAALAINWAAGPETNIAMFYLSPYYPSQQVVFHQIALAVGIFWGNVIYVAAAALGGFVIHTGLWMVYRERKNGRRKPSPGETDERKVSGRSVS